MKKTFFIIAGVVVAIGIAILIYIFFFAPKSSTVSVVPPTFPSAGDVGPNGGVSDIGTVSNAGTDVGPRLIKITDGPVALGSIAIDRGPAPALPNLSKNATTTLEDTSSGTPVDTEVRYIERLSGNVYSFMTHARTLTRISNKTLPGVQEASWVPDGSRAYARFLNTTNPAAEQIATYALEAGGGDGYLLEQNLSEAQVSGSSTLFTMLSGTTGSVGSLARTDGSNAKVLFTSVLGSLQVLPTSGDLFAHTKATYAFPGYGFSINRSTGVFTKILGGLYGLTVLPNQNGSGALYSYVDKGVYRLAYYDIKTHSTTALPVSTLTEKCVWASGGVTAYCAIPKQMGGGLPDYWYQGAVSFTDRIWKIDLATRSASLVVDPQEIGKVALDAVALTVDQKEDVLVFTDRTTGSLWLYDL
jgi:hypothetical protein